jgi:hypothetical protein
MNLISYSGYHDIIHTDEQQHDIVILEVYPVFWFQDLCTPVLYNDTPSKAIVNATSNITYRPLIEVDDTGR